MPQDQVISRQDPIESIRAFNRFYTHQLGLLDAGLLGSDFSLTEARVMWELAHRESPLASDLAKDLSLDFGYLSRILKKFEKKGFMKRTPVAEDARQSTLTLSAAGRRAFGGLNTSARGQVANWIQPLSPSQQAELVIAMDRVSTLLHSEAGTSTVELRELEIGDIGWIIRRQGQLYAEEYGWDMTYEALVAEIAGGFVKNFQPDAERAWVAVRGTEIVGSVFLVKASSEIAKLRLLYVEPSTRGQGVGRRLVEACIQFAKDKQYKTLTLWTNDVLSAARRIYIATGFKLTKEESHRSFGKDLIGQNWELNLTEVKPTR